MLALRAPAEALTWSVGQLVGRGGEVGAEALVYAAEFEEQHQFVWGAGENAGHEVRDEAFDTRIGGANSRSERQLVKVFPGVFHLLGGGPDQVRFAISRLISEVTESGVVGWNYARQETPCGCESQSRTFQT